MTEQPAAPPEDDGERIVRLETMFDSHQKAFEGFVDEQREANREARSARHEAANRSQAMSNQLSNLNLIVSGDGKSDHGMKGDVQELKAFFHRLKGGWWAIAIGATILSAIAAAGAWVLSIFGVHLRTS